MRRAPLVLLFGLLLAVPASAQTPRVGLTVSLGPDSFPLHARHALVRVRDLLADQRWSGALDQTFPIRLNFRLEIWRSREGWIDEFQRATEWATVIQREPLLDQYRVTQIFLSGPREYRFTTRDELARWLGYANEVEALPKGTGTFYYAIRLTLTALSEQDMDELERFLAGQPAEPAQVERSSIRKMLRQLALRVAGLPWDQLDVRSEKFKVAP